ncbi:hypothetical protein PRABACTJOHN_03281 [Parabacteroides johnsonii DSM 18315]|uniref:Uncharacterized protein n=1 Tax=Parabacteroides johnsonii DSM 18315 TaxID=537006 RepID=B7BE06_9BACT|nr:hypothetical protein PRABACTJOHN_03281 [Parabacteroides johnsonii DSM 18315]
MNTTYLHPQFLRIFLFIEDGGKRAFCYFCAAFCSPSKVAGGKPAIRQRVRNGCKVP